MEERLAAYLDMTDAELANLVVALLLEEKLGARLRCFREDLRLKKDNANVPVRLVEVAATQP